MGILFELEDKKWFPPYLRRMQTEYIGWLVEAFDLYKPVVPVFQDVLKKTGKQRVVDLGSGSGNPVYSLAYLPEFQEIHFILTDLYPNTDAPRLSNVSWHPWPVDARDKPESLLGLVTLFNAFHHFNDQEKKAILECYAGQGIMIFELLQPTFWVFLKIFFTTTIGQILLCPFVRPFRWDRLFFTWIIPVNLFTVCWDGLVSVLRSEAASTLLTYAPAEAKAGECSGFFGKVTYLYILPNEKKSNQYSVGV